MATIKKRGDRWLIQVKRGNIRRAKTFDTKGAAQRWATRLEAQLDAAGASDRSSVGAATIAMLLDRYVAEIGPVRRWSQSKSNSLAKVRRDIGHLRVRDLSPQVLIHYGRQRQAAGAGPHTVSVDLIYLGDVFKVGRAVWRWDLPPDLVKDALAALRLAGIAGNSNRRDRRPTAQEISQIKAAWRGNAPPEIVDFAIASAMRVGEICSIRWDDINNADRTIRIRDRKHPTKKIGNHQVVPLLGDAWSIVQNQPRTDDRIFPFSSQSISQIFRRAVLAAGVVDLRFHDLRHEAISRLFEQGYQIQEVAVVSGHADWAGLRRYTNLRAKDLHR